MSDKSTAEMAKSPVDTTKSPSKSDVVIDVVTKPSTNNEKERKGSTSYSTIAKWIGIFFLITLLISAVYYFFKMSGPVWDGLKSIFGALGAGLIWIGNNLKWFALVGGIIGLILLAVYARTKWNSQERDYLQDKIGKMTSNFGEDFKKSIDPEGKLSEADMQKRVENVAKSYVNALYEQLAQEGTISRDVANQKIAESGWNDLSEEDQKQADDDRENWENEEKK